MTAAAQKYFMPPLDWAFIADAVSESNIDPNVTFFETYGCYVVFFTSLCSRGAPILQKLSDQ